MAEAGGTEVGEEIGNTLVANGRQDEVLGALGRATFLRVEMRVEIWKRRTIERAPYEEPR